MVKMSVLPKLLLMNFQSESQQGFVYIYICKQFLKLYRNAKEPKKPNNCGKEE